MQTLAACSSEIPAKMTAASGIPSAGDLVGMQKAAAMTSSRDSQSIDKSAISIQTIKSPIDTRTRNKMLESEIDAKEPVAKALSYADQISMRRATEDSFFKFHPSMTFRVRLGKRWRVACPIAWRSIVLASPSRRRILGVDAY